MRKNKTMIVCFMLPAVLTLVFMYLYPIIRKVIMSFFHVESVTASTSTWSFNGLTNYIDLFNTSIFRTSMWNIFKIWLIGGVITMFFALLFAVILTSGVRFKNFFRAAIYLPNVISAVAMAAMWRYYVFNARFGFLNSVTEFFGGDAVNWLDTNHIFNSMLIAYCFGSVGYFMLIFLSGIERIPSDIYEAARIDGTNSIQKFRYITLPLLRGVFKTNITFWSVSTLTFFVWTKMFSPTETETTTVVPVVYLYNVVFGSKGVTQVDAGRGAAIGVSLAICMVIVFVVMNRLVKDDDLEF